MQNPHWAAPVSRNACWSGWSRSPSASPSTVVTAAPSASTASIRHESTLTPVDQDRARPALADETALLRPGQPEVVAQDLEQRVVRRDRRCSRVRPLTDSAIGRFVVTRAAAPREAGDRAADRPKAQDVEHRQPVLGARPHRPWRGAAPPRTGSRGAPSWRGRARRDRPAARSRRRRGRGRGPRLP